MTKHIAVFCALALPLLSLAQYRETRPVRGAWLRPPGSISGLETALQQMASGGITDLYLETFYWGVSTGKQGVFNSRFGYDYLAQAIPLAAKYGIRVSAWIESGYWAFGSTGTYNFAGHPEYQVVNVSTGTTGGDQASQIFVNLCLAGVQQKLRNYTAELAGYAGLWGVQTDYHRYPIDNNTSDAYPTPWTYEHTTNTLFQASYPSADITVNAAKKGQTYYNQFVAWRKAGIGEAANQEHLGILGVSNDVTYSAAVFSNPNSSAEASKCQDWPSWASNGYVDWIVPMAYDSTTSSIVSSLNTAKSLAGPARLVAGLAITGSSTHPALSAQMGALKPAGYEDFVIFDGTAFATTSNQTDLKNWLNANATPMRADFNSDGVIDMKDWKQFWTVFRGTPISSGSVSARYNFDGSSLIDSTDHAKFRAAFRKYRVGENGILTTSDRTAFQAAYTGPGSGGGWTTYNNLYDFDGDGDVDEADRTIMEMVGNTNPMVFLDLDLRDTTAALGRWVPVEIREPGSTTAIATWTLELDNAGHLTVPVPHTGNLDISIKPSHWLRRTIPVNVGSIDVPAGMVTFANGDIDGDNAVTVFDYGVLSDYFDKNSGDSDWNTVGGNGARPSDADLDEDGTVSVFDYGVLSSNFDLAGDA